MSRCDKHARDICELAIRTCLPCFIEEAFQWKALATEAGEALVMVESRYTPSFDVLPQKARTIHHDARDQVESILTKLRAAGLLGGNNGME